MGDIILNNHKGKRGNKSSFSMKSESVLIIAASEYDANLYYATRFVAPDAFCYIEIKGKKHLLMSDLEVDRARKESLVDQVHSLSQLARDFQKKHDRRPSYVDLIEEFLKNRKVQKLTVPGNFSIEYADPLRKRGFSLEFRKDPFFESRTVKTAAEVKAIQQAIRFTEAAIQKAIDTIRKSVIKKGRLYFTGEALTSERVKKVINIHLMENDCVAENSIVACGIQGVDPHNRGTGPLYANQSIIMDIFPRHAKSRYYADITRTVVRGKASPKLKRMHEAVIEGQNIAFKQLKAGVEASSVHRQIQSRFEALGFKTGVQNGRMQGFFHGTGHGLGLDIHEDPRFGGVKEVLKAGQIVTVEPGLYYEDAGGIRIEDDVLITKTGCVNLVKLPKVLEI